jgi:diguanylate cyclase (GGDEF)-like protein
MPRRLSWILRPGRLRRERIGDDIPDETPYAVDQTLEEEFVKWLQIREQRPLCEMFAALLAEHFGLLRSIFIRHQGQDETPETLCSRGVTGEMIQTVLADMPTSSRQSRRLKPHVRLEHSAYPEMTWQFSCEVDEKQGMRIVGIFGTRDGLPLGAKQQCRLEHWLGRFDLALQNQERIACLEALSYTDPLTGLFNRRFFKRRLDEEITRASRFSRSLSLVVFDLDRFKQLNDHQGHLAGDEVLKIVAGLLNQTVRSIDIACRYGGDEFVIIMPETSLPNCFSFTNRLRSVIFEQVFRPVPRQETTRTSISLGAAVFPDHAGDAEHLFWCADMALLKAKEGGGDRAIIYQPGMGVISPPTDRR